MLQRKPWEYTEKSDVQNRCYDGIQEWIWKTYDRYFKKK